MRLKLKEFGDGGSGYRSTPAEMISDAKNFCLDSVPKNFLPQDFFLQQGHFSCNHNIFLAARKKMCQEKKSLGKKSFGKKVFWEKNLGAKKNLGAIEKILGARKN